MIDSSMKRTLIHDSATHIGLEVRINGWVNATRRMGKMVFTDVRDISGVVQVVFTPENADVLERAQALRPEFVVEVVGMVNQRPEKLVKKDSPTGSLEILAKDLHILAESKTPPFEIIETSKEEPSEEVRYKYRYLDLRR